MRSAFIMRVLPCIVLLLCSTYATYLDSSQSGEASPPFSECAVTEADALIPVNDHVQVKPTTIKLNDRPVSKQLCGKELISFAVFYLVHIIRFCGPVLDIGPFLHPNRRFRLSKFSCLHCSRFPFGPSTITETRISNGLQLSGQWSPA